MSTNRWVSCTGLSKSTSAVHWSIQILKCRAQVNTNPWVSCTGLSKSISVVHRSIQILECCAMIYTKPWVHWILEGHTQLYTNPQVPCTGLYKFRSTNPRVPCTGLYISMSVMHWSIQIHECRAQVYTNPWIQIHEGHTQVYTNPWVPCAGLYKFTSAVQGLYKLMSTNPRVKYTVYTSP